MAVGDLENSDRPRFETNERLDLVDTEPLSKQALDVLRMQTKAHLAAPSNNVGLALPSGTGWTFTRAVITSPAPYDVRIDASPIVGIDADGNPIINILQQTINVSVAGTYYIYLYRDEDPTDNEIRKFIPSITPFTEFSQAINTRFTGRARMHFASGPLKAENAISGRQRPLLALAQVVFNGAGTMTTLTYLDNMITTVIDINGADPFSLTYPNTANDVGGVRDLLTLSKALLEMVRDLKWAGSPSTHTNGVDVNTATAGGKAVNYHSWQKVGAFRTAGSRKGLEETYRLTPGMITVGDGTTTFGEINPTDFGTNAAFWDYIFANNRRFFFKPGSVFSLTGDRTYAGVTNSVYTAERGTVTWSFGANTITLNGAQTLRFDGLAITSSDIAFKIDDQWSNVKFNNVDVTVAAGLNFIFHTNVATGTSDGLEFTDSTFTAAAPSGVNATISLRRVQNLRVSDCTFTQSGNNTATEALRVLDCLYNIQIENTTFRATAIVAGAPSTSVLGMVFLESSGVTTLGINDYQHKIHNCRFDGGYLNTSFANRPLTGGIRVEGTNMKDLEVTDCTFRYLNGGIFSLISGSDPLNITIEGNEFRQIIGNSALYFGVTAFFANTFKIRENTFTDVPNSDAITFEVSGAAALINGLDISDNTFVKIAADGTGDFAAINGVAIRIAYSGGSLTNLWNTTIDNNRFSICRHGALFVDTPTTNIEGFSFQNNSLFSCFIDVISATRKFVTITGVKHAAPVLVNGQGLDGIRMDGNSFRSIMSGNQGFSAADVVSQFVMWVRATNLLKTLSMDENILSLIAEDSTSGVTIGFSAWALGCRSDSSSGNLSFSNNKVGGNLSSPTSRIAFLRVDDQGGLLDNLKIGDNLWTVEYEKSAATSAIPADIISVVGAGTATTFGNLNMTGNQFKYFIGGVIITTNNYGMLLTISISWLGFLVEGNSIWCNSQWPVGATSRRGCTVSGGTIDQPTVRNNIAIAPSDATGQTEFTGPFNANAILGPAVLGKSEPTQDYVGAHTDGVPAAAGGKARNRGWK